MVEAVERTEDATVSWRGRVLGVAPRSCAEGEWTPCGVLGEKEEEEEAEED